MRLHILLVLGLFGLVLGPGVGCGSVAISYNGTGGRGAGGQVSGAGGQVSDAGDAPDGAGGQLGTGGVRLCECDADYSPVCGVNGETYGNLCAAECAGVETVAYEGACGHFLDGGVPLGYCDSDNDCVFQVQLCCGGTCVAKTDPTGTPPVICNIACEEPSCSCVDHQCTVATPMCTIAHPCASDAGGAGTGGSGDGGQACDATSKCPTGETCIMGGTCAESCAADGGAPCPAGTSCQTTSGYCQGTACSAIAVWVCR